MLNDNTKDNPSDKIFLQDSDIELLKSVNFRGGKVILRKGDILYNQDDMAISFYLILDGSVELTHVGGFEGEAVRVYEKDSFFGFNDLFHKNKRSAECVARTDTTLIEIFYRPDTRIKDTGFKEQKFTKTLNTSIRPETFKGPFEEAVKEHTLGKTLIISILLTRCNFGHAPRFKSYVFNLIENDKRFLIIDLKHCKIIDSTFLGVLVAAQRKIIQDGGNLKLVVNQEIYSWLFLVTRMDKVFKIFTDIDSAINANY